MSKERNAIHKLSAGTVLNNRYEIIDLLGAGGFGNTYLARDTRFSATTLHVCVKEFFLSGVASRAADGRTIMLTDPTQAQNYEDGRLRFRREAERMFTLRDEHIVRVSDLFDENGTSYYVMDYIAGQSLAGLIQQRGALSEPEALKYILQLLQGLRVIHSVGMVHLDIKPGNAMIDKSGKVVLIDFGASKIIENGSATLSAAILTTPGYAPLEQALCQLDRIGEWTDLYAVGGTLYKLLSGRTPATSQAIIDEGRAAFDFPAETSNATRELIFWLMNERISNRPHSTEEVITRVEALLEELKEGNHAAETPSASSDDIPEAIPIEPQASSPGEANIPLAEVAQPQPQQPAATPKAKATKAPQPLFTAPPPPGAQTSPPRNGQVSPADPAAGSAAATPQGVPPSAAKPTAAPQGNASPTPTPAAPCHRTNQQPPRLITPTQAPSL
ncbi:MAG: protein kinase [Bacteroidaceae bacterium]|nr:protein kinase [Bacteroidaceae bacterium]